MKVIGRERPPICDGPSSALVSMYYDATSEATTIAKTANRSFISTSSPSKPPNTKFGGTRRPFSEIAINFPTLYLEISCHSRKSIFEESWKLGSWKLGSWKLELEAWDIQDTFSPKLLGKKIILNVPKLPRNKLLAIAPLPGRYP